MSVIAVKKHKNKIEICADSQKTWGHNKTNDSCKLLKCQDNFIIGQAGNVTETHLLFHYSKTRKPERNDCQAILDFLLEFQIWYRQKIENNYQIMNHHIIVFNGKIYHHQNYDIKEIEDYSAIGSGYNEALAALYLGKTAYEAVEVSCALTLYCCLPVHKIEVDLWQ